MNVGVYQAGGSVGKPQAAAGPSAWPTSATLTPR